MNDTSYRDKDTLERLYYEDGLSQKEIANKFDVARNTISSWMNRHNIGPGQALGTKRQYERDQTPDYQKKDVLESLYYDEGLTQQEIADKYDVAFQTISEWMTEHDINPGIESGWFDEVQHVSHFFGDYGYEVVASWNSDTKQMQHVKVHRLVAVAEYGMDKIEDMDIHHKNDHPADNRPCNLEVIEPSEHYKLHGKQQSEWMETNPETGNFVKSKYS